MESNEEVHDSKSILFVERINLPVSVPNWVLIETRDILEGSPSLTIISWLVNIINKLGEISIGLLGQSTKTKRKFCLKQDVLTVQSYLHAH